jgi:hypothetical protein
MSQRKSGAGLTTRIYPSKPADESKIGAFRLLLGMIREGGIRLRTWDSAIDDDPPYIDVVVQLDGDTLLRVHPRALSRPDLLQHHRRAFAETVEALTNLIGRVRLTAMSLGGLTGGAVGWFAIEQLPEIMIGIGIQTGAVAVLVGAGGFLLNIARSRLLRAGIDISLGVGSTWLKTRLAGHNVVKRVRKNAVPPRELRARARRRSAIRTMHSSCPTLLAEWNESLASTCRRGAIQDNMLRSAKLEPFSQGSAYALPTSESAATRDVEG